MKTVLTKPVSQKKKNVRYSYTLWTKRYALQFRQALFNRDENIDQNCHKVQSRTYIWSTAIKMLFTVYRQVYLNCGESIDETCHESAKLWHWYAPQPGLINLINSNKSTIYSLKTSAFESWRKYWRNLAPVTNRTLARSAVNEICLPTNTLLTPQPPHSPTRSIDSWGIPWIPHTLLSPARQGTSLCLLKLSGASDEGR